MPVRRVREILRCAQNDKIVPARICPRRMEGFHVSPRRFLFISILGIFILFTGAPTLWAQASAAGHAPETPAPAPYPGVWRNQGSVAPCVLPWGGVIPCPPPPGTVAIRAGRMFDSLTGKMLTKQVILIR